jgi:uncharacterized membrane protein
MNIHDEDEIKKEFQLERLIFFSDAVFAIIITIMILDVKLPEVLTLPTEAEAKKGLLHILPKLMGYTISFFVIGSFWMRHLKVFSFLKDYNRQLIALNLLFLFSVSLFPFALSFTINSAHITQYPWGLYTYIGIIYFMFFTQTFLIHYLVRNANELCLRSGEIATELHWKVRRLSYFGMPTLIILMVSAGYFGFSQYIVYGVMALYGLIIKRMKKKWYPNAKDDSLSIASFFRKAKIELLPAKRVSHKQ